jgi:N-acylneuraminate cytidylyltransferase
MNTTACIRPAGGQPVQRRQDLPPVYLENGAVLMAQTDYLLKEKSFITHETVAMSCSERSWDIDNERDFYYCSLLKGGYYDITS